MPLPNARTERETGQKHNASGGPRTGGKGIKRCTIVILEKMEQTNEWIGRTDTTPMLYAFNYGHE